MRPQFLNRYNPRAGFDHLFHSTPRPGFDEHGEVMAATRAYRENARKATAVFARVVGSSTSWPRLRFNKWTGYPTALADIAATDAARWAVAEGVSQETLLQVASRVRPMPVSESLRKLRQEELLSTAASDECSALVLFAVCLELRILWEPDFDVTTAEQLSVVMSNNIWGKTYLEDRKSVV